MIGSLGALYLTQPSAPTSSLSTPDVAALNAFLQAYPQMSAPLQEQIAAASLGSGGGASLNMRQCIRVGALGAVVGLGLGLLVFGGKRR